MSTPARWFVLPEPAPSARSSNNSSAPVIVLGAGLAGAHCAYELAQRNVSVILIDAGQSIASGASGNDTGIVKPYVTRAPSPINDFYQSAFNFLLHRFTLNPALAKAAQFNQCGVLQLVEKAYPANATYDRCTAAAASKLAGIQLKSHAIHFAKAGWLNPASLCKALVEHKNIDLKLGVDVNKVETINSRWHLSFTQTNVKTGSEHGVEKLACDTLILANGEQLNRFVPTRGLALTAARGQTNSFAVPGKQHLKKVINGKHYVIPTKNSVVVGASFIRDDETKQLTDVDHQHNVQGALAVVPELVFTQPATSGFCATRATTLDRLPIVGPVPDFARYRSDYALIKNGLPQDRFPLPSYQHGLYAIGGFGSRGIVSAPYCASLLVDYLYPTALTEAADVGRLDAPLSHWSSLLHPARFIIRELKRATN